MSGKKRVLFALLVVFVLAAAGCNKDKNKENDVVATVNGEAIYMNEIMYYIYGYETEGNASEEIYQAFYGKSFWDETDESGMIYRQLIKEAILEDAVFYEIFYLKAKESGYTLDEDEREEIKADAGLFLDSLTEKQKNAMNITQEELINVLEKEALAGYYYNDFLDTLNIDEAMATSMITEEDYRQYDVEYIYIPTIDYDENYEQVPFTEEKKKEAYDKIAALLPKALDGKELSDLLPEDDETMEISQIGFMEGDQALGAAFVETALSLKNGQVADKIIEETEGYYIIKMIDDFSLESYEREIDNAVAEAQNEAFLTAYDKLKSEYKIVVNEEIWGPIIIGQLTYDEDAVIPEEDSLWGEEDYEPEDDSWWEEGDYELEEDYKEE